MSLSHRREVAKKLKDAIEQATDPQVIAQLSNQLSKYLPRPRQSRRRRGIPPPIKANKTSSVVAKWADRLSHLPEDEERIQLSLILEFEERDRQRRRSTGQTFTEGEQRALLQELMGSLSAEERAILNGGSQEVA
jgi:hypothetical protein